MRFITNLTKLREALGTAAKHDINLENPFDKDKTIYNFQEKQKEYHYSVFAAALKSLKNSSADLNQLMTYDYNNQDKVTQILELMPDLDNKDPDKLKKIIDKIEFIYKQLNIPKEIPNNIRIPQNIPSEIKAELAADIREMNKCFASQCYRSAVIMCGRILETALFRKYFDTTGQDLLEKAPGTGLGNLIAKLKDKSVELDPALTNQIHLINQIRIFSVHKKKEPFMPSKDQTQAIILYTIDILEKLF